MEFAASPRQKRPNYKFKRLIVIVVYRQKNMQNFQRNKEIYEMYNTGYGVREIADFYGLKKSTIWGIIYEQRYKLKILLKKKNQIDTEIFQIISLSTADINTPRFLN